MKFAVKIFFIFLLLFFLIVFLSYYLTVNTLKPDNSQTVKLHNLQETSRVEWNQHGVPRIQANHTTDAIRILGYLHARDRLWQMTKDQYRLLGLNSKFIDPSLVSKDRFYLTLAFKETAFDQYERLNDNDKELLTAYVAGINEYIRDSSNRLPIEFTLSSAKPVEWEPWHVVGFHLLWNWRNNQSFWSKLPLHKILIQDDDELTHALIGDFPKTPEDNKTSLTKESYHILLNSYLDFSDQIDGKAGYYGTTGFARGRTDNSLQPFLFINLTTPHQQPSRFYEAIIETKDYYVAGLTLPGIPAVFHGQNDGIAWSISNLSCNDGVFVAGTLFDQIPKEPVDWERNMDLYSNLSDEVTVNRHLIALKNGNEVFDVTLQSKGKPIIAISEERNLYLAFDWLPNTMASDFSSLLNFHRSSNANDIQNAVSRFKNNAVQVLFVTSEGTAGALTGGSIINPSAASILNNKHESKWAPAQSRYPDTIFNTGEMVVLTEKPNQSDCIYSKPWNHAQRFDQLLHTSSNDDKRFINAQTWNNDTYSVFAETLVPHIIHSLQGSSSSLISRYALPYLENWNFEYGSNETAATLFELFLIKASKDLYLEILTEEEWNLLYRSPQIPYSTMFRLVTGRSSMPDVFGFSKIDWIEKNMDLAVEYLLEFYGSEPHDWQWGRVVSGTYPPTLHRSTMNISHVANLSGRLLFRKPVSSVKGSSHTIFNSHISFKELQPVSLNSGTTASLIVSPFAETGYYSVLDHGQTENYFSDWFSSQSPLWLQGKFRFTNKEFESDTTEQFFIPK